MCFTGSTLFLLYLLAIKVFKNNLSNRWKYVILKFVLLFFLTPLGFFKLLLPKLEKLSEFQLSGDLPIMVSTPDGIYPNFTYQTNKTVVIIWIVTAIIIFIWQQLKYFHLKKLVKQSMTDIVDLNILS